jgi:hypothetical protein
MGAGVVRPWRRSGRSSGAGTDRWYLWLAGIVLAGFAVRLTYILGWRSPVELVGDSLYYHFGGRHLADGEGFVQPLALNYGLRRVPGADHPPAYIVYLGFFSKLGFRSVLEHQVWSAVLGSATVGVVGVVGRRIGGPAIGLIAAGLAALMPSFWLNDAWVLAETMAIFAASLVLLAAYRCWDRPTLPSAAVLGLTFGLAALSRSELLLLAPLVVLPLAWYRRRAIRRPVALVAVAAATTVASIAPWALYNLSRFDDETVLLSNQLDRTMAASWCDSGFYGENIGYKSYNCLKRAETGRTDAERRRSDERAWKRYAEDHVERIPLVAAARVGRLWYVFRPFHQLDREIDFSGAERPAAFSVMVLTWVSMVSGAVGAWKLRRNRVPLSPLLAMLVVVSATAAITFGQLRYRAPAEPALALLMAAAFLPRLRAGPEATTDRAVAPEDRPLPVG